LISINHVGVRQPENSHKLDPKHPVPTQILLYECTNDWSNRRTAARSEDNVIQRVLMAFDIIHVGHHAYDQERQQSTT